MDSIAFSLHVRGVAPGKRKEAFYSWRISNEAMPPDFRVERLAITASPMGMAVFDVLVSKAALEALDKIKRLAFKSVASAHLVANERESLEGGMEAVSLLGFYKLNLLETSVTVDVGKLNAILAGPVMPGTKQIDPAHVSQVLGGGHA